MTVNVVMVALTDGTSSKFYYDGKRVWSNLYGQVNATSHVRGIKHLVSQHGYNVRWISNPLTGNFEQRRDELCRKHGLRRVK
jgi:hypothetical protein